MFYGSKVEDTRRLFFSSWQKSLEKAPLTPLEEQIAQVVAEHPEYHSLFSPDNQQDLQNLNFTGSNPFLHMGLHISIREQITTNRPQGICVIYEGLLERHQDTHQVEHLLIEPLAETLWQAQQNQEMPNEQKYLNMCKKLIRTQHAK